MLPLLSMFLGTISPFALPGSRPNVLLYLTDDWAYEFWPDGSAGIDGLPTNYTALLPHIARHFVQDAMSIQTMYAQATSAPSRRSLFSGRFMSNVGRPFGQSHSLSTRISTVAERLRAAGYTNGLFGKWFLGYASRSAQPVGRGFDSSLGFHLQSTEQYGFSAVSLDREQSSRGETLHDLFINDTVVTSAHPLVQSAAGKIRYSQTTHPGGRLAMLEADDPHNASLLAAQADDEVGRAYAQDVLNDEMARFVALAPEPFFGVMSTSAVHKPLDSRHHHRVRTLAARRQQLAAASRCLGWYSRWAVEAAPTLCSDNARDDRFEREAMALAVDDGLGQAIAAIHARGSDAWARTLLLFVNDNGGALQAGSPNAPLRGGKSTILEGGLHVRAALGGGHLPVALRGQTSRTVLCVADLYPTLSYLAGLSEPHADPKAEAEGVALPVDGRNAARSWRRLLESGGATNELVAAEVADVCQHGLPSSHSNATGCLPSTRLIEHDRIGPHGASGSPGGQGHSFTLVSSGRALKVYGWTPSACLARQRNNGCPYDPGAAWYLRNNVCPSTDPSCAVGPCPVDAVSGAGAMCTLHGCTHESPCIFDVAADPAELQYLRLPELEEPLRSTLRAVTQWQFGQTYATPYFAFRRTSALLPALSGHGYSLAAESSFDLAGDGFTFVEELDDGDRGKTYDRLAALGRWVLGPIREAPLAPPLAQPPRPQPPSQVASPPPPTTVASPSPPLTYNSYTYSDDDRETPHPSPPPPPSPLTASVPPSLPPPPPAPCLSLLANATASRPRPDANCSADGPTVGVLRRTHPAAGYVLYSPRLTTDVWLLDVASGQVAHEWRTNFGTGHGVYMLPSGDLVRLEDDGTPGGYAANASISIPGDASLISVYDWSGGLLWRKVLNNATHRLHHQIDVHDFDVRAGTGTLFALAAYRLNCSIAASLGRAVCDEAEGLYIESILEIDTAGDVCDRVSAPPCDSLSALMLQTPSSAIDSHPSRSCGVGTCPTISAPWTAAAIRRGWTSTRASAGVARTGSMPTR